MHDLRAAFLSLGVKTGGSTSAEFRRMLAAVKAGASDNGGARGSDQEEEGEAVHQTRVSEDELGQWLLQLE